MAPFLNFRLALFGWLIGILAGIVALVLSQAASVGLSIPDESAHFLNGYFINLYIKNHFGANPMAFAKDFYLHYPKLSIGHWPPAYYGFIGLLFLFIAPSAKSAFIINLFVSSLPAAGVALVVGYALNNARMALISAFVYALMPLALEGQAFFLLDQAVATCCVLATIAWIAYAERPVWRHIFLFALFCVTGILTKGNGWLLGLMPVYHILITRKWRILSRFSLYTAATVVGVLVIPWYWLTAGIAADGFNYQPGLHYAWLALKANTISLVGNVGIVGMILFPAAIFIEFKYRKVTPRRWLVACGCLSLIGATFTLQSLVPADLESRYLTPALPAVVVLIFMSLYRIYSFLMNWQNARLAFFASVLLIALVLLPAGKRLANAHPKVDYHMPEIVSSLSKAAHAEVWLVDGATGAEGAFIAEMAVRDPNLNHYVVRATKFLSESNFMEFNYKLKYKNPEAVVEAIHRLGIQRIVIVKINNQAAFPHSDQLSKALQLPEAGFEKIMALRHGNRLGTTEVYQTTTDAIPDIEAVRAIGLPAKASGITSF